MCPRLSLGLTALLLSACSQPPLTIESEVRAEAEPMRMGDRVDFEANAPALATSLVVVVANHTGDDLVLGGAALEPAPPDKFGAAVQVDKDFDGLVPAGGTVELMVRMRPEAVGSWSGSLRVEAGGFLASAPATLEARVLVDADGDGWSEAMGDCDDAEPLANPGLAEDDFDVGACDGINNDCAGGVDDPWDGDGDGALSILSCPDGLGTDCDDTDNQEYPGNIEQCDLRDNDCNGVVNDIEQLTNNQAGVCEGAKKVCSESGVGVAPDDFAGVLDYQAIETACDGLDNDCDGGADDFDYDRVGGLDCVDDDGDGYSEVDGDCDDANGDKLPEDCRGTLIVTALRGSIGEHDRVLPAGFVEIDTLTAARKEHPYSYGAEGFYAGASMAGELVFIHRGQHQVVEWLTMVPDTYQVTEWPASPRGVALASDGTRYVLSADGALTSWGQGDQRTVELGLRGEAIATGLLLDEPGDALWVCDTLGDVHRVDLSDDTVQSLVTGYTCWGPPVLDVAHDQIFVLGQEDRVIVAVDRSTVTVRDAVLAVSDISSAGSSYANAGSLSVHGLWVSHGVDGGVSLYDPWTLEHVLSHDVGANTQAVLWDPDRGRVWLADFDNNKVLGVVWNTGELAAEVAVSMPTDLFFQQ